MFLRSIVLLKLPKKLPPNRLRSPSKIYYFSLQIRRNPRNRRRIPQNIWRIPPKNLKNNRLLKPIPLNKHHHHQLNIRTNTPFILIPLDPPSHQIRLNRISNPSLNSPKTLLLLPFWVHSVSFVGNSASTYAIVPTRMFAPSNASRKRKLQLFLLFPTMHPLKLPPFPLIHTIHKQMRKFYVFFPLPRSLFLRKIDGKMGFPRSILGNAQSAGKRDIWHRIAISLQGNLWSLLGLVGARNLERKSIELSVNHCPNGNDMK